MPRFDSVFALFLPLLAGLAVIACVRRFCPRAIKPCALVCAAAFFALGFLLLLETGNGLVPKAVIEMPMGMTLLLQADYPAMYFIFLTGLLVLPVFHSFSIPVEFLRYSTGFFVPALVLLGSAAGFAMSTNLMWMFVFWEIASVCAWLLKIFADRTSTPIAADREFISGEAGSLLVLLGIIGVYAAKGTPDLALLKYAELPRLPVLLMVAGAIIKTGIAPFAGQFSDSVKTGYCAAALTHGALLVNFGGLFLLRALVGLDCWNPEWNVYAALLLISGAVMSAGAALSEFDSRKIIALSMSANAGLAVFGLCLGSEGSASAAMELVFMAAAAHTGLFLAVGAAAARTGGYDIRETPSAFHAMPYTALACGLCALGVAGVPPAAGFTAKFALLKSVILFSPWAAVLFMLALVLNGLAMARLFYSVFFTGPVRLPAVEAQPCVFSGAVIAGATALVFGVLAYYPAEFIRVMVSVVTG
ncbi:MAG: proton-conducting transporter membrane subunit [Elusimicrobiaceae bacterium]|nr:proton-conducting transporter membrane subunit [Elusimicrobiaceae bacterium]